MSLNSQQFRLGVCTLHGPTVRYKRCSIFDNMAELFGTETNEDAAQLLRREWQKLRDPAKLDPDAESDYVSVLVAKAHVVTLAVLINRLAKAELQAQDIADAEKAVKSWKQPRAFPWKVGDLFSMQLSPTLTAYGQVLDDFARYRWPSCVLFSLSTSGELATPEQVLQSTPISILHVQSDELDDQSWRVFANANPVLDAGSGPCGRLGTKGSSSWHGLDILAKAWFGLTPWNKFGEDCYLDKKLLSGVKRPENTIMLDRPELEQLGVRRHEWTVQEKTNS